jgi:hypothetical protein
MFITHCHWHVRNQSAGWPYASPAATSIPAAMKRRLTPLARQVMAVLYQTVEQAPCNIPWVMASRRADISRKNRLLTALAEKDLLSPTDFSLSVHNALLGLFSIATNNTQPHTAISAGDNSFTMGLLEAFSLATAEQADVGYLYYDMQIPELRNGLEPVDITPYTVDCIALLLSARPSPNTSDTQLHMHYTPGRNIAIADNEAVCSLVEYLQHERKTHRINLSGGSFNLEQR